MPFTLKNLPMLHKIALTPMCTHKLARSREDLKLQKKGQPITATTSPTSNKNVAAETEVTATCNMTLEKISDDQTVHSEPGAESDALTAAVHREMNEGPGNDSPMANDLCTEKEDILEEKESQELWDVRSASYRLNDETNLPYADEDSTLRAMKKAARRNLDGDSSGLKLADQALQPVATPPVWQTTSGKQDMSKTNLAQLSKVRILCGIVFLHEYPCLRA
ncbi:hypothetical protein U9M48_003788 [Paspalum notatum var. saurae]|uniref:Uncharacterized protein n=1 Tax=Paspalum notatum var. saurae TaxID=547442 RepID=A0AAQ3PU70_PASNO